MHRTPPPTPPLTLDVLPVQYGAADGADTAGPDTADTAVYVAPRGDVVLRLTRTPRRLWAYRGTDRPVDVRGLSRKRWRTPEIALRDVAYRWGYEQVREVQP